MISFRIHTEQIYVCHLSDPYIFKAKGWLRGKVAVQPARERRLIA